MVRIEALSLHGGFLYDSARFLRCNTGVGMGSYSSHCIDVPEPRRDYKLKPLPSEKAGRCLQTQEGISRNPSPTS